MTIVWIANSRISNRPTPPTIRSKTENVATTCGAGAERQHPKRQGDQDQPRLGRSGADVRQLELAKHARRQESVDRQQQVTGEAEQRDVEADERAEAHASEDQQSRQPVAAMVDEIAERRALDPAEAGEAAIHRIAEPVKNIAGNR